MDASVIGMIDRNAARADALVPADKVLPADNVVRMRRPDRGIRETPLASRLAGPMAGRFCAWRGASDRRYVTSVYPVDRLALGGGLPDCERFVLISVACGEHGRMILGAVSVERASERRAALVMGMARGADEWHIHMLAEDRAARDAVVADLSARHGTAVAARRA